MTDQGSAELLQKATQWWSTDIIDIKPGVIRFRGFPIEQLIGRVSFPQMIWLMLKGDLPSAEQGALLEAALVSAVDHGPQAPSIAIGRMAVTCGLPLNGAMASAINVLDDIHGGAGEQCMVWISSELYFIAVPPRPQNRPRACALHSQGRDSRLPFLHELTKV